MRLFHATTKECGDLIIKDGMLKKDIERFFGDCDIIPVDGREYNKIMDVTNGYVYFTDKFSYAIKYGMAKTTNLQHDELFYVFKLDIPDDCLMVDMDELKVRFELFKKTIPEDGLADPFKCLEYTHSTRVDFDVALKDFNTTYTVLPKEFYRLPSEQEERLRQLMMDRGTSSVKSELRDMVPYFEWHSI